MSVKLAIYGWPKTVTPYDFEEEMFHWPIVTDEDISAVTAVLKAGRMSGIVNETADFEKRYAEWVGTKYALAHCNGTMALLTAMWAAGVKRGDELICPSITYWASAAQAISLGASVVFADVDADTLCIDPKDIEHRITPKTKAIMVVHYCGYPCDMDAIMRIARKHGLKVIEDVSHAHGSLFKGRPVGTFGDVAAMSMMSGKSFPIGEGGILVTDDMEILERSIAFGHYERHGQLTLDYLKKQTGVPLGGVKGRINQACSAMGLVQLKHYPARIAEIQKSINYFWDLLEGTPGLKPHRPAKDSNSTMGGWYNPVGLYAPEELGGLPVEKFIDAVNAEGGRSGRGINAPLHRFPFFTTSDVYGDGKPSNGRAQSDADLPVASAIGSRAYGIPYFKHYRPEIIERYAAAFKKVAQQADKLL